jgi:type IV secretory pathway component VirB8
MSLFIEYGKDSNFIIKVLTIVICVETFVIAFLGLFIVKQKIVYINPSSVIGTSRVGYVPDEMSAYFAMTFISFLGNINPYSAFEQYKAAYQLMSPKLQSAMKSNLESEIAEINKSNISIQTTPIKYKVKNSGESASIDIEAIRISYAYGQEAKKEKVLYNINCNKAKTRASNPFGLEVNSYDYKVIAAGDNITSSN